MLIFVFNNNLWRNIKISKNFMKQIFTENKRKLKLNIITIVRIIWKKWKN